MIDVSFSLTSIKNKPGFEDAFIQVQLQSASLLKLDNCSLNFGRMDGSKLGTDEIIWFSRSSYISNSFCWNRNQYSAIHHKLVFISCTRFFFYKQLDFLSQPQVAKKISIFSLKVAKELLRSILPYPTISYNQNVYTYANFGLIF